MNINSREDQNLFLSDGLMTFFDQAVDTIQDKLDGVGKNLNVFVIEYDSNNDESVKKSLCIKSFLDNTELEVKIFEFSPKDCGIEILRNGSPSICFRCFVVNTRSIEKFRDSIKSALWPNLDRSVSLIDELSDNEKRIPLCFELSKHGRFIPYLNKKHADIIIHSFDHTQVYRYRLAQKKLEKTPKNLNKFLYSVLKECPNHIFRNSGFRASKSKFFVNTEVVRESNHDLIDLATKSLEFKKYRSRHENLQKFFLDHDPCSIAVELPLWIEKGEYILDYEKIFGTGQPLTGHIDLLRLELDGKIGVWDYKPKAHREKKAVTQVFLYTLMLSVRTGIPLSQFKSGYFDEVNVFIFDSCKIVDQLRIR